jgi:acyl carrier protein
MTPEHMKSTVASFIRHELLPVGYEIELTDLDHLLSDRIVDSMAVLRLVAFLEEEFDILIKAHQMNADHLDSLELIVNTVMNNQARR